MKYRLLSLAVLVLLSTGDGSIPDPSPQYGCETEAYPPLEQFKLPWFQIDLDASPRTR